MTRVHLALALVAAVLGLAAPLARSASSADAAALATDIEAGRDHISAPELADRLMRGDSSLRVFDLRSSAEFDDLHIPTAQLTSTDALLRAHLSRDLTLVVYSEGGAHAAQAWVLLRLAGYQKIFVLREGMYEWVSRVRDPRLAGDATPAERAEFDRAVVFSRFFGGTPVEGVLRSDVPVGYWTLAVGAEASSTPAATAGRPIRRRGC